MQKGKTSTQVMSVSPRCDECHDGKQGDYRAQPLVPCEKDGQMQLPGEVSWP